MRVDPELCTRWKPGNAKGLQVYVCRCTCVSIYACVCVCLHAYLRERDKYSLCVPVCVRACVRAYIHICLCVNPIFSMRVHSLEQEGEKVCVNVCVCVCVCVSGDKER